MKTYPICLIDLDQRQCVVIGGGQVAARKVQSLWEAGARVTVISPAFDPELLAWAGSRSTSGRGISAPAGLEVRLIQRTYHPGDLSGAFLVIAATNDPQVNQAVWEEACQCGSLVNVVDDPAHSNFILPAVVRRGEVAIAISTGGASPALARRLREQLEAEFGPEYGDLAEIMADLRPALLEAFPPGKPRLAAALALLDSDLLATIREQGVEAARERAGKMLELMVHATRSQPGA